MANKVEIIIEAIDKTKGAIDNVNSYFSDLADTFGEMSIKALPFIDFIQDSIDYTVDFHEQVKELSTTTGMTIEDTSRLIGAASGFSITYSDLVSGMEFAVKHGREITTEELGIIGEEYKRLGADDGPVAQAKYLVGIFGQAGFGLAALFEEGASGVETAMNDISSYVAINEGEDTKFDAYEKSLADFNDQLGGLKIAVATEAIPALTTFIEGINSVIGKFEEFDSKWRIFYASFTTMGGLTLWNTDRKEAFVVPELKFAEDLSTYQAYRDYVAEILELANLTADGYGAVRTKTGEAIDGVIILTEEEWKAQEAAAAIKNEIAAIPNEITKTIIVDGYFTPEARKALDALGFSSPIQKPGDSGQGAPKAAGGPVSANTPYIIGEKGPELFVPNAAGKIIPNNQLQGSGGQSFDYYRFARIIAEELQKVSR